MRLFDMEIEFAVAGNSSRLLFEIAIGLYVGLLACCSLLNAPDCCHCYCCHYLPLLSVHASLWSSPKLPHTLAKLALSAENVFGCCHCDAS